MVVDFSPNVGYDDYIISQYRSTIMATIFEFAYYGIGVIVWLSLAFFATIAGGIIDDINWVFGKMVAIVAYAISITLFAHATNNAAWVNSYVVGMPGFNTYWMYAIIIGIFPFIGRAQLALGTLLLVSIPSVVVLANG